MKLVLGIFVIFLIVPVFTLEKSINNNLYIVWYGVLVPIMIAYILTERKNQNKRKPNLTSRKRKIQLKFKDKPDFG